MNTVYLSLGSNLGNRRRNLESALGEISRLPGTRVTKSSSLYKTGPILPPGSPSQPDYFNQAVGIETRLSPSLLLGHLLAIEIKLGRIRRGKNDPRPIDIDIIYFGRKTLNRKNLIIPHPRAAERRFVLKPLCEIAPRFPDPVHRLTIAELLESAPDGQKIRRLPKPGSVQSKK